VPTTLLDPMSWHTQPTFDAVEYSRSSGTDLAVADCRVAAEMLSPLNHRGTPSLSVYSLHAARASKLRPDTSVKWREIRRLRNREEPKSKKGNAALRHKASISSVAQLSTRKAFNRWRLPPASAGWRPRTYLAGSSPPFLPFDFCLLPFDLVRLAAPLPHHHLGQPGIVGGVHRPHHY
jgi:hypothetical protein